MSNYPWRKHCGLVGTVQEGPPPTSTMGPGVGTQEPPSRGVNCPRVHHPHRDRGYGELPLLPPTPHPSKAHCARSLPLKLYPHQDDCAMPPRKPLWKERGGYKGLLFLHKEQFLYSGESHSLHYEFTPLGSLDQSGCSCSASAPLPWSGHSSSLRGGDPESIQQWLSSRPWEGRGLGSTEGGRVVPKSGEALRVKSNYVWEEEVGPIPSPSGWKENWSWTGRGCRVSREQCPDSRATWGGLPPSIRVPSSPGSCTPGCGLETGFLQGDEVKVKMLVAQSRPTLCSLVD